MHDNFSHISLSILICYCLVSKHSGQLDLMVFQGQGTMHWSCLCNTNGGLDVLFQSILLTKSWYSYSPFSYTPKSKSKFGIYWIWGWVVILYVDRVNLTLLKWWFARLIYVPQAAYDILIYEANSIISLYMNTSMKIHFSGTFHIIISP